MKTYNENSIWSTMDGRSIKLKDLTDTHLANIIDYICKLNLHEDSNLFSTLCDITQKRGLKEEFLDRAQIPYKNQIGQWEIWDKERGFIILERKPNEN